jgi:hypothetical protein
MIAANYIPYINAVNSNADLKAYPYHHYYYDPLDNEIPQIICNFAEEFLNDLK